MCIIHDYRPKIWRFETTSSSFNLESINLEDENIPHVPNVDLERPLGKKTKKKKEKKKEKREIEETKEQRMYNFKYGRLIKCHDGRKKKIE